MGSRYGSLKQMDKYGPSGETILDYSVYDAIRAGFGKVVFVIRNQFSVEFKNAFGKNFESRIEVKYVAQELENLPFGFSVPANRVKPWGTAHAVWCAQNEIDSPFAVINADDFYGRTSFSLVAEYLNTVDNSQSAGALVGYVLENTLSEHGTVSRGVCNTDAKGNIASIVERRNIAKDDSSVWYEENGEKFPLTGNELVSMNLFGFTSSAMAQFDGQFVEFLKKNIENPTAEFYLPQVASFMIQENIGKIKRISTPEKWFGVTYPQDKPLVISKLKELTDAGVYPVNLWA